MENQKGFIMPAAARAENVDSASTGHLCDVVTTIAGTLQTTVRINGSIAAVRGDALAPHTILAGGVCIPHAAVVNAGSSTVRIANIPAARLGDSADAGSIISGSSNVFIGG